MAAKSCTITQTIPTKWTNLATRSEFAEIKTELSQWLPQMDAKPKKRKKK